jgi:hypothetical protein
MNPRVLTRSALLWLLYVLLHLFVTRNLALFDYAFCFIYVAAILVLPYEINLTALLFIAFGTGVIVDSFDNTLGMHAAATVLTAYIRPTVLERLFSQKVSESRINLSLNELGLSGFLSYVVIMISIHHFALFFIEASSMTLFVSTLIKALCSIVFTTFVFIILQLFVRS